MTAASSANKVSEWFHLHFHLCTDSAETEELSINEEGNNICIPNVLGVLISANSVPLVHFRTLDGMPSLPGAFPEQSPSNTLLTSCMVVSLSSSCMVDRVFRVTWANTNIFAQIETVV